MVVRETCRALGPAQPSSGRTEINLKAALTPDGFFPTPPVFKAELVAKMKITERIKEQLTLHKILWFIL